MITETSKYDYDVAFSYAGEDRPYVQEVADILSRSGVRVFYDVYEQQHLWGKNLYEYLSDIYSRKARYTVIFISRNYARKSWTNHERTSAQARAFAENREYILPARFDDTVVPGVLDSVGYVDLTTMEPTEFANLIAKKVGASAIPQLPLDKEASMRKKALKSKATNNKDLPLILYSVVTSLAFRINEQFYNQLHYVWCAPYFDMRRSQPSGIGKSPRSANPFEIYAAYLRDARSGDLHSHLIAQNKTGIKRGAQIKLAKGHISQDVVNEIQKITNLAVASDYTPLIYVIPSVSVVDILKSVPVDQRAHPLSREFIIEDMPRSRFDVMTTEDPMIM